MTGTEKIRASRFGGGVVAAVLLAGGLLQAQTATTTTLASITPSALRFGQVVTLTAQVAPASASGTVSFEDRGVLIGVGALNSSGVATLATVTLPAGNHALQANYGGGAGYQASQSPASNYVVTALPSSGFGAPTIPAWGAGNLPAFSLAAGDFNGDGKADLAVAVSNNDTSFGAVSVLLGAGNGAFQPPSTYYIGPGNSIVAVGDFNGDGVLDVVAACTGDNNIYVLLGYGDGTFQAPRIYSAGGVAPWSIAVTDFNGDGKTDLLIANSNPPSYAGSVSVLLGNGDGTFQTPILSPVGLNPTSIAVGDLNGDGIPDAVVADEGNNYLTILLGDGAGGFQTAVLPNPFAGYEPGAVAIGDFNGDGKADLAVTYDYLGGVAVLQGIGDGAFQPATQYPAGSFPTFVAVGDFNGDGKADLVFTNGLTPSVCVLLGNGDGTFQSPLSYGSGNGWGKWVVVADFNGDGVPDLAVANGAVNILLGLPLTVTPRTVFLDATAQMGPEVSVTAGPAFDWTSTAGAPWIMVLSGAVGRGSGTATFSVVANIAGSVQTGNLTVAGQTVTVTQRATADIFADVAPADYYFDFADLMYQAHITAGCSTTPLDYCPSATINRGEMAVFLIVAIEGGNSFTYTTTPYFTDVPPSNPYFKFIQKLKDLGITGGCTATTYCPNSPVTREEMAVFIIVSRYGTTPYTYPATPYFTDVPAASVYFPFVQKMAQAGITAGCGGGLFCPNQTLTRGQMAVFIVTGLLNELLAGGTPTIASVIPNSTTPGQTVTVTLTGVNTNFVQGTTQVAAAAGIAVSNVTVLSATSLQAQLAVGAGVAPNPTSIVVTTESQEAVLPNGFLIQ